MARQHDISISIARRLRLSADRFAAAAAVQDPNLLLQLKKDAESGDDEESSEPPRPPRRPVTAETGAALLLMAAVALALLWSNSPWRATYGAFWHAPVALTVGPWTLGADLRTWIDEGLMTLFFLVVGLEAKRERDLGELTPLSMLLGVALWLALFESGIDPVISGLAIGLLTNAYEPQADGPAPISPNDRIQHRLHPLTSMVVVPIFAMANAGLHVDGHLLGAAATSPVTWGIVLAFLLGKPLGILLATRLELRGTALVAGTGFTVSLLIASRAFDGAVLDQAKVGILVTVLVAPVLAVAALAPLRRRAGARAEHDHQLLATALCPAP